MRQDFNARLVFTWSIPFRAECLVINNFTILIDLLNEAEVNAVRSRRKAAISEPAARHSAIEWELTALAAVMDFITTTRFISFMPLSACFTTARSRASSDALYLFGRTAGIG